MLTTATSLKTYVHDHLAGAQFAIELLADLRDQAEDERIKSLAAELADEVEADRQVLQRFAASFGDETNGFKETAARFVQKLSQLKLSPGDKLGAFEAVEALSLGVLGKLALWNALVEVREFDNRIEELDLARLTMRAKEQYDQLESLRLALAPAALLDVDMSWR